MRSRWHETDEFEAPRRRGWDLAEFVAALRFEDLPPDVVHQARRVLLEGLSWMLLGSRRPEAAALRFFLDAAASPGPCRVAAYGRSLSAGWAAFANGALAQIQDCNDGMRVASVFGASFHPGRVVIPAALAACEEAGTGGADLLTAIVSGYEVAGRVRGLEPRPPADAYAAAAVAARIRGLDPGRMLHAMGIAGHHASPIPGADPYDVTFLTVGNIARAGVEAARMAESGLTGPPPADDSRLSPRLEGEGLGESHQILDIYMKPFIGCRLIHGAVEAALELRSDAGIAPDQVERVVVRVIPEADYITGHVGPDVYYRTCQLSLPYCMACAFIDGDVGEAQFTTERIAAADVLDLHHRILVVTDEALDADYPYRGRPTVVELETTSGEMLRWEGRYDKGEPENPFSDTELVNKFRRWGGPSLSAGAADELLDLVFDVAQLEDLGALTRLVGSAAG